MAVSRFLFQGSRSSTASLTGVAGRGALLRTPQHRAFTSLAHRAAFASHGLSRGTTFGAGGLFFQGNGQGKRWLSSSKSEKEEEVSEAPADQQPEVVESEPVWAEEEEPEFAVDETPTYQEKEPEIEIKERVVGAPKRHTFKAETKKILDIMAKSVYTDREVFVRELISNASDALEKARYLQSTNQIPESEQPFEIRIYTDSKNNRLIIQDSGIGMTSEEMIGNLGTIAHSGSKAFMGQMEGGSDAIIGQFGVGFYSTFMVSDKVEVYSKSAVSDEPAHQWISDGSGEFDLAEAEGVERGTKIISESFFILLSSVVLLSWVLIISCSVGRLPVS